MGQVAGPARTGFGDHNLSDHIHDKESLDASRSLLEFY
jgi:hypothetical protein